MKNLQKSLLAAAVFAVTAMGTNAAVTYGAGAVGQSYVGAKVGKFDVDVAGVDNPTAYGMYAGYQFDPNFGAEVEYLGSSDADVNNGTTETFNAKTYGAYGTYNYNFVNTPVYAKGKLGLAKVELKSSDGDKADKTGVAGGLGVGFGVNANLALEADYNFLPTVKEDNDKIDNKLWTVGAKFKF